MAYHGSRCYHRSSQKVSLAGPALVLVLAAALLVAGGSTALGAAPQDSGAAVFVGDVGDVPDQQPLVVTAVAGGWRLQARLLLRCLLDPRLRTPTQVHLDADVPDILGPTRWKQHAAVTVVDVTAHSTAALSGKVSVSVPGCTPTLQTWSAAPGRPPSPAAVAPAAFATADGPLTPLGPGGELIPGPHGLRRLVNLRSFGAVGDGAHDDSSALSRALQAGDVLVPRGVFRIAAPVVVPPHRRLTGVRPGSVLLLSGLLAENAAEALVVPAGTNDVQLSGLVLRGTWKQRAPLAAKNQSAALGLHGRSSRFVSVVRCSFEDLPGFAVHDPAGSLRTVFAANVLRHVGSGVNINGDYALQSGNGFEEAAGLEASGAFTTLVGNHVTGWSARQIALSLGGRTSLASWATGVVAMQNVLHDGLGTGLSINDGARSLLVQDTAVLRCGRNGVIVQSGAGEPPQDVLLLRVQVQGCGTRDAAADFTGVLLLSGQGVHLSHLVVTDADADDTVHRTRFGVAVYPNALDVTLRDSSVSAHDHALSVHGAQVSVSGTTMTDVQLLDGGSTRPLPEADRPSG